MPYLVFAAVVIILAIALQPKVPSMKPPELSEIDVPTAEQGRPIAKVFGRVTVQAPNIVWYGDLGYNKIKSSGGK